MTRGHAIHLKDRVHDLEEQIDDDDNVVAWPQAFNRGIFYGQEYPQSVGYKPFGIWYGCGNDWLDRIAFEESTKRSVKHHVYRLELDRSNFIIINSEPELLVFSASFSVGPFEVNWAEVAKVANGIQICPYQSGLKDRLDWYNPWDVASGCTWDPATVLGVEEIQV